MAFTVRQLTPAGRGAVAVVRIESHGDASACVDDFFTSVSNRRAADAAVNSILYGHWGGEDVVVVRTSEQTWEVNCHGGAVAVDRIINDGRRN